MKNVILSAFADEYASDFGTQLAALKSFGIKYIEVRHVDSKNVSVMTRAELEEAKRQLDEYGIRVSAIGSPLGKIRLDADTDAHLDVARRVFEAANIMGAKYVRAFSFYAPEGQDITTLRSDVLLELERLVSLAESFGVVLCHENEAKIYGDVPERCLDLMNYFSGRLKCVFDMGNFVLEGVKPYEAYKLLQPHIAYFHIKDALFEGAIVPPGKGEAEIQRIITEHRSYASEDFFTSLEPHLETFSGLNALVGRSFKNPYRYSDAESAFTDAVTKYKELIQ